MSFFSRVKEKFGYVKEKVDYAFKNHGLAVAATGAAVTAAAFYGGYNSIGTMANYIYTAIAGLSPTLLFAIPLGNWLGHRDSVRESKKYQRPLIAAEAPKAVETVAAAMPVSAKLSPEEEKLEALRTELKHVWIGAYELDLTGGGEILEINQSREKRNPNSVNADQGELDKSNKERKENARLMENRIREYEIGLYGQPRTDFEELRENAKKDARKDIKKRQGWVSDS